mmetsp:Transcript_17903/g.50787  ORF Transcript_17903/g.50787 Transcript_17903/m.50787 type:complete len:210 (-) Transcript_17903:372-1001(-)
MMISRSVGQRCLLLIHQPARVCSGRCFVRDIRVHGGYHFGNANIFVVLQLLLVQHRALAVVDGAVPPNDQRLDMLLQASRHLLLPQPRIVMHLRPCGFAVDGRRTRRRHCDNAQPLQLLRYGCVALGDIFLRVPAGAELLRRVVAQVQSSFGADAVVERHAMVTTLLLLLLLLALFTFIVMSMFMLLWLLQAWAAMPRSRPGVKVTTVC